MLFENLVQGGSERGWKLLRFDGRKLINSRGPESYARRSSIRIMRQALTQRGLSARRFILCTFTQRPFCGSWVIRLYGIILIANTLLKNVPSRGRNKRGREKEGSMNIGHPRSHTGKIAGEPVSFYIEQQHCQRRIRTAPKGPSCPCPWLRAALSEPERRWPVSDWGLNCQNLSDSDLSVVHYIFLSKRQDSKDRKHRQVFDHLS
jgi:hypothetical protein